MNEENKKRTTVLTDLQMEKITGGLDGDIPGGPIDGNLDGTLEGNVLTFICHKCGKKNRVVLADWSQPPCTYCNYVNGSGPV